jgi:hypothetical protein
MSFTTGGLALGDTSTKSSPVSFEISLALSIETTPY